MKTIEIETLITLIAKQRDVYEYALRLVENKETQDQIIGRMQGTLDIISMLKELQGDEQ